MYNVMLEKCNKLHTLPSKFDKHFQNPTIPYLPFFQKISNEMYETPPHFVNTSEIVHGFSMLLN
jgi:hypothetical protein